MVDNPRGGRREARGLWAWKLETLDPGTSTTVTFTVGGLSKGDWTEFDIFFRGAGDIIGATKIDEEILAEMLREEDVGVEHEDESLDESPEVVIEDVPSEEPAEYVEVESDVVSKEEEMETEPEQDWFGVGRGEEE